MGAYSGGRRARVEGYRVGGKTGTVRKTGQQGYATDAYRSVFAGIAPISDPRIVTVVMIDNPQAGQFYGGAVAAPYFPASPATRYVCWMCRPIMTLNSFQGVGMTVSLDQFRAALKAVWPGADLPELPPLPVSLDLVTDSRKVAEGSVFVAVPGSQGDGREYIDQALEGGASLVLAHTRQAELTLQGKVLSLPHLARRLGELGRSLYQVPDDLEVIAVTGTNGKSSVTHYVAVLSELLGIPAGVMSTLGVGRRGS